MPAGKGAATAVHPFIPYEELPAGQRRRIVIGASLRTIATIIVVVAIYFLIPMDHLITAATVIELVTGGLALFAIIAWQIREIMRAGHPGIRASAPLKLLLSRFLFMCLCSRPPTSSWLAHDPPHSVCPWAAPMPCTSRLRSSPPSDSGTSWRRARPLA